MIAVFLVIALVGLSYAVWAHLHQGHAGTHDHSDHGAAATTVNPASGDGVLKLAEALREDPKYFAHTGWSPLPERQP